MYVTPFPPLPPILPFPPFPPFPRDPAKRPTAKEALKHPWLRGDSSERGAGKQIDLSVVQRIQRFAQSSHFKRTVFRLIAEELLSRPGAMAALAASASQQDLAMHERISAGAGGTGPLDAQEGGEEGGLEVALRQLQRQPSASAIGVIRGPESGALRELYRKLHFDGGGSAGANGGGGGGGGGDGGGQAIDKEAAADALEGMGFRLRPSEAMQLVDMMDTSGSGKVRGRCAGAGGEGGQGARQRGLGCLLHVCMLA